MINKTSLLLVAITFLSVIISSPEAQAQKIKVKKIKGRTALVETSIPLVEGQSYELEKTSISSDVNYAGSGLNSRQHSLSLGLNFSTYNSTALQRNSFLVQGRYGWNYSLIEFGTVGQLSFLDIGDGGQTDFMIGGYFDYNLVSNRDLRTQIYGPFALLSLGSTQKKGASASLIDLNAGGFFSYFLNGTSTAIRLEAFVDFQQVTSASQSTSLTGFGGRGLLLFYF